jgi:hypothetical protein
MVANIVAAFQKRIEALSWMDPSTKAEAQAKLTTLYVGIGYPETWHDYSAYEVKADDIFGNVWRGGLFDYHRSVERLGKAVDRKVWSMTPQTVNAVNLPLQNALNFPAAILQPPFFDAQAPAAANYGAIGTVIGHEIPKAASAIGGLQRTSRILRPPPQSSLRSTTPINRSPTFPSTAVRRSRKTSLMLQVSLLPTTAITPRSTAKPHPPRTVSQATSSSSLPSAKTGQRRCVKLPSGSKY